MVDVNSKRIFFVSDHDVGPYIIEKEMSLGELLHELATRPRMTAGSQGLTPREHELVQSVVACRDRAPASKRRADSQPVLRAAFALADSGARSGDHLDALISHLETTVREYREGSP